MTDTEITQADRDVWNDYGPEIFHGVFTGPALVVMVRIQARNEALAEAAEVAEDLGNSLKALGLEASTIDIETGMLRLMQADGALASAERIRALTASQGGEEG